MSAPCTHDDFTAFVDVARITTTDGGPVTSYAATIRVDCALCGEPFRWIGAPVGLSPRGVCTSVDGGELRAPLRPFSAPDGFGEDGPAFHIRIQGQERAP